MLFNRKLSRLVWILAKRKAITQVEGFAICISHVIHTLGSGDEKENFARAYFLNNDGREDVQMARIDFFYHPRFSGRIDHWYKDYIVPYLDQHSLMSLLQTN